MPGTRDSHTRRNTMRRNVLALGASMLALALGTGTAAANPPSVTQQSTAGASAGAAVQSSGTTQSGSVDVGGSGSAATASAPTTQSGSVDVGGSGSAATASAPTTQ